MDGQKLKYDRAYDCWVLEPIQVHNNTRNRTSQTYNHRHSSAETFATSSATSTPHSRFNATPQRRSFSLRYENTRAWKSLRRYWTCLKASTDSNNRDHYDRDECYYSSHAMRRPKPNVVSCRNAMAKTNSLASCYSAMSNEERDENLKAVILYCKGISS